nr:hypothetical protein GCM10020092_095140 [Actinoplanes digitatis]
MRCPGWLISGSGARPMICWRTRPSAGGTAVVCQVLAGMGGVGKTQLAANLAEHLWQARTVDLLVWVTAGSRDNVVNTYAQVAADVTGAEDSDPARAAQRLLAWLAGTGRAVAGGPR